jgi:hypothetical protein
MPIEIAGIKFPRVHRIVTSEQAAFVQHRIPGLDGNLVQNMGRDSVRLQIDGIFYGPTASGSLDKLRSLHLKREPVDFIADVIGAAYAGKVTLDHLDVTQAAHEPDQFSYSLIVSEYIEPPKTELGAAALNDKIALDANARLALVGLPDALSLGSLPELTNPFEPLKSALEPTKQATDGLIKSVGGLKTLFGV